MTDLLTDQDIQDRIGNYITTYSGGRFWPLDPRAEDININDIAHALSNICRYTGHVREFYSVAQHSVEVSNNVPKQDALFGLLHDASEAYINDVARPLKHSPVMNLYRETEDRIMDAVCEKFGLPLEHPKSVKLADRKLLVTEIRDLMNTSDLSMLSEYQVKPLKKAIHPLEPKAAKSLFLDRFYELSPEEV
jgi:5'-deoxynucleotidase YfbR-like HD superfamily hydrolase